MTKLSLRGAIDAKCRDCGGQEGGDRYWRLHVSVCPVTACPLWRVRPIASRNAPPWLASRDPGDLPDGFLSLSTEKAIAVIRGAGGVLHPETGDNSETKPAQVSEGRRGHG
jgi:hypothetical protein